ncbi:ComEC/Rec2 family competence protein [Candidatus Liberibacter sp.]|uniref:ComEC/Rec2 family competence protein n=1 Tax=Candidatus Liberibacter sp. TaxID=34022 RepID=UPI00286FE2CA|nr:ComEC/Rec2 family competence protein [Candidatus Liberibacter sp.]
MALTERFPIKKIAAFGALFTVTSYFLISGANVPTQRAYFMTVVMLISYLFDKHSNGLRSIALTAIVIICFSPSEVIGPSFQMSFATTTALIAINAYGKKRMLPHPLLKILPDKGMSITAIIRFFKTVFITSLIGSASASIFLIKYFHCIPLYGLIANLLAIPILSFVVMPSGLIAVLLMTFSLDDIPLHVMGWGLEIVINISNNISTLGDEICMGRISKTSFIFAVIGFVLLVFFQTNIRHIGTIMIVFIAIPVAIFFPYPPPDLIVSEDGKLVAFLYKNTLNSNNSNPSQFILSQWETALMATIYGKPKKLKKKEIPKKKIDQDFFKKVLTLTKPGSFLCVDKLFCTGYHHESGLVITTLKKEEYAGLSCQFSDILITEIEGIKSESCGVSLLISPETLREKGSLEIRIIPSSNKGNDRPSFIVNGAITNPYAPWNKNGRELMLMPRQ